MVIIRAGKMPGGIRAFTGFANLHSGMLIAYDEAFLIQNH